MHQDCGTREVRTQKEEKKKKSKRGKRKNKEENQTIGLAVQNRGLAVHNLFH